MYAYWHSGYVDAPKRLLDDSITRELRCLEREVEKMAENLSNTLLVVTADPGIKFDLLHADRLS